jgi:Fis family transcriptional regulator, factor for inversion stimulation protein
LQFIDQELWLATIKGYFMELAIAEPQQISQEETTQTDAPLSLSDRVQHAIQTYFTQLEGEEPHNLYPLVLTEMEVPLLKTIMQYTKGNQSRAAKLLGLSRGTLRKKLSMYQID